ncbi:hypothetical protein [Ottowia sp.]|uniref:hypothetical protein n=1 Tax=Ottowia sp. TaxID=1898956 RepID=UPI0025D5B6EC|nr:hypothetical protein [Ottowia sp.]MBK6616172.1 hypothetical protein [Ottowia sp.]
MKATYCILQAIKKGKVSASVGCAFVLENFDMNQLFHGTPDDYAIAAVSGYDGIWWTAPDSTVAQTYIPPAKGFTVLNITNYEMKDRVTPCRPGVSILWDVATMIQPGLLNSVHAQYDITGHATSYTINDAHPTARDICIALENVFGYLPEDPSNSHGRSYRLNIERIDELGRNLFASADWRRPGFLWIVDAPESLKLYDMTSEPGDLANPQYHELGRFRAIREAGFSGVIINDYTQSRNWGTVGHLSYGFFPDAIPHLLMTRISAKNFDWGPTPSEFLGVTCSPEYLAWLSTQQARAAA